MKWPRERWKPHTRGGRTPFYSIRLQCKLAGVSRSGFYYKPEPWKLVNNNRLINRNKSLALARCSRVWCQAFYGRYGYKFGVHHAAIMPLTRNCPFREHCQKKCCHAIMDWIIEIQSAHFRYWGILKNLSQPALLTRSNGPLLHILRYWGKVKK